MTLSDNHKFKVWVYKEVHVQYDEPVTLQEAKEQYMHDEHYAVLSEKTLLETVGER